MGEEEERLRSLMFKLQAESSVLDRVVYKNKNQHRHSRYFQYLLKVRRDLKLLESAKLSQILHALSPIIGGTRPAEMGILPSRAKKQSTGAKYSYHERLLGVARLLSEMPEPLIKAATDLHFYTSNYSFLLILSHISMLLAKSFFVGFSTMVLALLGRIRVIVQQMLLDVVVVFNKVSEISQSKQAVKVIEDGIEAFRDYNPVKNEVVIFVCEWKEDKFVLFEKLRNKKTSTVSEDAITHESTIQYSTVLLFDEDKAETLVEQPDATLANNVSSRDQSNGMDNENNCQKAIPEALKQQDAKRKNIAFVSVAQPKILSPDPRPHGSSKKHKLNQDAAGSGLPKNLFDDLEFSESRENSIF